LDDSRSEKSRSCQSPFANFANGAVQPAAREAHAQTAVEKHASLLHLQECQDSSRSCSNCQDRSAVINRCNPGRVQYHAAVEYFLSSLLSSPSAALLSSPSATLSFQLFFRISHPQERLSLFNACRPFTSSSSSGLSKQQLQTNKANPLLAPIF